MANGGNIFESLHFEFEKLLIGTILGPCLLCWKSWETTATVSYDPHNTPSHRGCVTCAVHAVHVGSRLATLDHIASSASRPPLILSPPPRLARPSRPVAPSHSMPFPTKDTPSRAGYTGARTVARSPTFTAGHRAELRSAMAALRNPDEAGVAPSEAEDHGPPEPSPAAWPEAGLTVPVAPVFASARPRRGTTVEPAHVADIPADNPLADANFTPVTRVCDDAPASTWPVRRPTRPCPPSLSTPRASVAKAGLQSSVPGPPTRTRTAPTIPRPPKLSTTSRSRKSIAVLEIAAVGAAEDVPERRQRVPVTWTGEKTVPRAPIFTARPPRPVTVTSKVPTPAQRVTRSAEERRAAFERLTAPRPALGVRGSGTADGGPSLPKRASAPVIRGEDRRAIFERLTRSRQSTTLGNNRSIDCCSDPASRSTTGGGEDRDQCTSRRPYSARGAATGCNPLQSRCSNAQNQSYVPGRTVPKPFQLKSVELHDAAIVKFEEQKHRDSIRLEEKRRFRAVPLRADMLEGPTFIPTLAPPELVVTETDGSFCRASDVRAESRAEFEAQNRERIERETVAKAAAEAANEALLERKRVEEYNEKRFRARPLPLFRPEDSVLPPVPAPLPPTSPHTPYLATRSRTRALALLREKTERAGGGGTDLFGESSSLTP